MDKKIEYYEDCEDFMLDVMTGGCMYQVGFYSCVVDKRRNCEKERINEEREWFATHKEFVD